MAVAAVSLIGFLFMNKPDEYIEGQVEGTTVRVSGKLAGRVEYVYVSEGDSVRRGDTLVYIHSSVVEAQLAQAEAMRNATEAQNRKVDAGTRIQLINTAADLLAQAQAGVTITEKTYRRMENLFNEGVVSEQKRDEARAAYDAAVAARDAAANQLELARDGAQSEDRESSAAMVDAADGSVQAVEALLADSYLTAPCDGTVDQIFPEQGELVAMGAPIMSILKADERWMTFNVREQLLSELTIGTKLNVTIPALDNRDMQVEIYYIRDMGTYATWRSTKPTGSYDSRTFNIKARPVSDQPDLRPGMSVIFK